MKRKGRENKISVGKETGRGNKKVLSKIDKTFIPHNTRNEIAQDLGWSANKVARAQQVSKKAPVKEKLRSGEMSINQAYQEIKTPKKEPDNLFTAESPEELLKKAKEVAKERAQEKRAKIEEKGSTPEVNKLKSYPTVRRRIALLDTLRSILINLSIFELSFIYLVINTLGTVYAVYFCTQVRNLCTQVRKNGLKLHSGT